MHSLSSILCAIGCFRYRFHIFLLAFSSPLSSYPLFSGTSLTFSSFSFARTLIFSRSLLISPVPYFLVLHSLTLFSFLVYFFLYLFFLYLHNYAFSLFFFRSSYPLLSSLTNFKVSCLCVFLFRYPCILFFFLVD